MIKLTKTVVGAIAFASILFLGAFLVFQKHNDVSPAQIDIFEGASFRQTANLLENYGAIQNADFFYYYTRAKLYYFEKVKKEPIELLVKHGHYDITSVDFDGLLTELNSGPDEKAPSFIVTIPEGYTLEKIGELLEEEGLFAKEEFMAYIQSADTYKKYQSQYSWLPAIDERKHFLLEGYLQANTYNLPDNPTVELLVDMMLKETDGWRARNQSLIDASGLTFDEVLTLASVVEAESKFSQDRPKVAQVFLNRLAAPMKLESDMTAAYANREHKVFMYYEDIETASPFNTYHVEGLPIGPINSPSAESFVAVLQPEGDGFDALYFYARPSGETFYAVTWDEHEANRLKWEHEWKSLETN